MGGVYIHIPFCRNKCLYCDFYSGGVRIADWKLYVDCLFKELQQRKGEIEQLPETLYLGGGTPSLMPGEVLEDFIHRISKILGIKEWKEFTLEANPEDVSEEKCRIWKMAGVNRVSLGVQTLNEDELKRIGRRHDSRSALTAIEQLKRHFENVSVDVMFGIPGQTLESYQKTLETLIESKPAHVSSYSLMLEEGTALARLKELGKISLPEEEEWMKMFRLTNDKLKEAGYNHYEISNYSQPGYESRHNMAYWQGEPYIGLGPGAHSYDGERLRRANRPDLKGYLKFFSDREEKNNEFKKDEMAGKGSENVKCFFSEERLSDNELREEMIMTRLRTARGLDLELFETRFGKESLTQLMSQAEEFIKRGELKFNKGFLSLTEAGIEISDLIMSSLF